MESTCSAACGIREVGDMQHQKPGCSAYKAQGSSGEPYTEWAPLRWGGCFDSSAFLDTTDSGFVALTEAYYGRALSRLSDRIVIRHGDNAEQPFVIDTCAVDTWFPSVGSPISSAIALNGKHGEYPRYKTRPLPLAGALLILLLSVPTILHYSLCSPPAYPQHSTFLFCNSLFKS